MLYGEFQEDSVVAEWLALLNCHWWPSQFEHLGKKPALLLQENLGNTVILKRKYQK
jgi:hypothetical protein